MKAIQVLNWIIKQSISGEILNFVDVPAENDEFTPQTEEWWTEQFGFPPPTPIKEGKYLYYYMSSEMEWITDEIGFEPDATIELSNEDNMFGSDLIYLYRMED